MKDGLACLPPLQSIKVGRQLLGLRHEQVACRLHVGACRLLLKLVPPPLQFIRGRVNADAAVDLSDAIALLLHLFAQRAIPCAKDADANDDGALDIADGVRLLDYLFAHGDALPAPASVCGVDLSGNQLDCAAPSCP
jgi:hypothetical protein